jgi:hypothetical protein
MKLHFGTAYPFINADIATHAAASPQAVLTQHVGEEAPLPGPHAILEKLKEVSGSAQHTPAAVAPVC